MSVTIDVNDMFQEMVKQNERLVKEIEFYEEVVNDLMIIVKTCIVCQQNNVIKDRINRLETHLKSKTTDNSIIVKNEYIVYNDDYDNNLKTTNEDNGCVQEITDFDSYISCETSDGNKSDNSLERDLISSLKTKSLSRTKKRSVKDVTDSVKTSDANESVNSLTINLKTKSLKKTKSNEKSISENVDKLEDNNNKSNAVNSGKRMKSFISDEYEQQKQKLREETLTSDGSYQCQTCDYKSKKFPECESHVNRCHLKINPYKCDICGEQFVGYGPLRRHKSLKHYYVGEGLDQLTDRRKSQIVRSLNKYQCQYCQKFLRTEQLLNEHVSRVHYNVKPGVTFGCDKCNKLYFNRTSLNIHKRKQHGIGREVKYYHCDWIGCQFKTSSVSMVTVHQKRHLGIRDYVCDYPGCQVQTATISELNNHKLVHSDSYNYRCQWPGCEFLTKSKRGLKLHTEKVHEESSPKFACHWTGCDKTFRFNSYLKQHLKLHNEPDLPCPFCSKLFKTKSAVDIHVRTHTGAIRVPCPVPGCQIQISGKANIKHHMRYHHKDWTPNKSLIK
ncbi:zinc finger protein 62 homolog [Oppia nitens]|uniref:zinc finger protein 62 homolog n=1 Tax=Oppia nitens TaxID=1686743 RepID=UPI0023D9B1E7|nr:zinc finger protein 62 homolog [Oppia nitens]XP_054153662.1 zinc finger protein 62 homolog [Oppia nitens]